MAYFSKPEELIDYWHDALSLANLGFEYVGYAEEQLAPKYPSVMMGDAATSRDIHATHQFGVVYTLSFFIYHAKLTVGHRVRTREDLQLVSRLRDFLHADPHCQLNRNGKGPGVVFGWVTDEAPGVLSGSKGDAVVGTRIAWSGQAIVPFT